MVQCGFSPWMMLQSDKRAAKGFLPFAQHPCLYKELFSLHCVAPSFHFQVSFGVLFWILKLVTSLCSAADAQVLLDICTLGECLCEKPVLCTLNSTQVAAKNKSMAAESRHESDILCLHLEFLLCFAWIKNSKMLELLCRWTLSHLLFPVLLWVSEWC